MLTFLEKTTTNYFCVYKKLLDGNSTIRIFSSDEIYSTWMIGTCTYRGVSWPSGLAHRTQVLVLSENQNVGSIPGSDTCVLEQDT